MQYLDSVVQRLLIPHTHMITITLDNKGYLYAFSFTAR
jgi:hypothetical protein